MLDFTIRDVRPDADAPLLHSWVTAERAAHWGMRDRTVEEVAEVYGYIAEQRHLRAFLIEFDGLPLALMQTYDPAVDEIGEFYDRQVGDLGVHLFLADDPARAGRTSPMIDYAMLGLFADPSVRRLVLEPDTSNAGSIALLERIGADAGPRVHLALPYLEKDAQFYFITRERWEELRR